MIKVATYSVEDVGVIARNIVVLKKRELYCLNNNNNNNNNTALQ
jgi:hypothetical protein